MKKKITRMSDNELSFEDLENGINTTLTNDEVRTGSITPTTFYSRELYGLWYQDTYSYNQYSVVKFGIDKEADHRPDLVDQGIKLDGQNGSSRIYAKYSTDANKITLSKLECKLINQAVEHLINSNNIVLVDIFERVQGGSDNGNVQTKGVSCLTHTVVLYKNSHDNVLVIDPSNFTFSSHLSKFNYNKPNDCSWKISTLPIEPQKILKIYEAPSEFTKGTNFDQYRNCTDIAVKIAFGLQTLPDVYEISVDNLPDFRFIRNLSNLDNVNPHIFYEKIQVLTKNGGPKTCNYPTRIQQASDPKIVSMFDLLERTIDNEVKVFRKYNLVEKALLELGLDLDTNGHSTDESLNNYIINIGTSTAGYQSQLEALQSCYRKCSEVIDNEARELLGTGEWS